MSPEFDYRFEIMNEEIRAFAGPSPGGHHARRRGAAALPERRRSARPAVDGIEPRHDDGVHFPPVGSAWLTHWMLPTLLGPPGQTLR